MTKGGRGWIGKLALGLFGLLILAAVGLQIWEENQQRAATAAGTVAPDFTLERLDGSTITLSSLKGRLVLVDFWATWCPPCREEMPHLVKLAKEFEAQGVSFVAANQEGGAGTPATVRAWVDRTLPELAPYVAFGTNEMGRDYGLEVMPTLVFIDREGNILETVTGSLSERVLRRKIETALSAR